ncbi:MAG: lipid-A-disaccharide synthase [Candidatus Edwardsbacteria bacterium]
MEKSGQTRIMIVAGEASGDLHGSFLVKELKKLNQDIEIFGIGGERLQDEGVELLYHIKEMSVVGFFEVIRYLPFFYQVLQKLKKVLRKYRPNLLILIDYPGLNLRLAKIAKTEGIPILYYISPQVWAWGKNRLKKIAQTVNKMVVVFPFEKEIYQKAGVDVEWTGHPLLDVVKVKLSKEDFFSRFSVDKKYPLLGFLPGSRREEVKRMLPIMLKTAEKIKEDIPNLQLCLGLAPQVKKEVENILKKSSLEIRIVSDFIYEMMQYATLLLVASGTATLEAGILGTPMVILYKTSFFSWLIAKKLVKVKHIGLVNIVAGKRIIPEFLQYDAQPGAIALMAQMLLLEGRPREVVTKELRQIRKKLGEAGASRRAAEIVWKWISR